MPGQQPLVVATLRGGEILDGSWLGPPYLWTFDARASDLVRVLGVDARCLRDKCEAAHDLGYELMKRIRRSGGPQSSVPAIALTAFARSEDRMRALRAGYQTHVAKPVEPAELVATVASLMEMIVPEREE